MKTLTFFRSLGGWCTLLLVLGCLGSCKDKDEPKPIATDCRIDFITHQGPDVTNEVRYFYDQENRIVRIAWTDQAGGAAGEELFSYTTNAISQTIDMPGSPLREYQFTLNDAGYISQRETPTGELWTYAYNSDGYLTEEWYVHPDIPILSYHWEYEVVGGNIVGAVSEDMEGNISTVTYDYDTERLNKGGWGSTIFGGQAFVYEGLPYGKPTKNLLTKVTVEHFFGPFTTIEYGYVLSESYVREKTVDHSGLGVFLLQYELDCE